jgi:hypothetical protein
MAGSIVVLFFTSIHLTCYTVPFYYLDFFLKMNYFSCGLRPLRDPATITPLGWAEADVAQNLVPTVWAACYDRQVILEAGSSTNGRR